VSSLQSFEEIEEWQVARGLTRRVYQCSANGNFARDRGLQWQIRRAAVSIMSNVAEGFERRGSAEFAQFLAIARGSTAEVQSQLYVALDAGHISIAEFTELQRLARSTTRLLTGFIKYLKRSPLRGQKFRQRTDDREPQTANRGPQTVDRKPRTADREPGTNP
jgi:four helix bundle protein